MFETGPKQDPTREATRDAADATPKKTILLSADWAVGDRAGDRISHYQLIEEIGAGGMGTVWKARQEAPVRRNVALKVINLGMASKEVVARFEAERQALALMNHANIPKILDAGATDKGLPFFVMELVPGIAITKYCDQERLDTEQRLRLIIQVCHAIHHAHQRGIIHRDIKPSNILVEAGDHGPVPKLIDFGIAKARDGQKLTDKTVVTVLEQFIGTPAYMSPEQAEMSALGIDWRTDIYSLGVLLYELLTSKTPFNSETLVSKGLDEMRRIIREDEPPRPSTLLSALGSDELTTTAKRRKVAVPQLIRLVSGDLDWIVMKAMEKDRTRRYQSAEELAADIERHLANQTITAKPPSLRYTLQKFVHRRKVAFGSAVAILLLAPAGALLLAALFPRHPSLERLLNEADDRLHHYDREGYIAKAVDALTAAKQLDANNAEVWARLGWAGWLAFEDQQGEPDRMAAFLASSNALVLNPNNDLAHRVLGLVAKNQGNWLAATNHLLKAKQITKDADGLALILLASACQAAGDVANARQFSEAAEKATRGRWEVFDRLGTFYQATRNDNSSVVCFSQAVQLAPQDPLPHLHLGQALVTKPDTANAIREFKRALRLRDTAAPHGGLGTVYLSQHRFEDAAEEFKKAVGGDGRNYHYFLGLAIALHEMGAREESRNVFRQTLAKLDDTLENGENRLEIRACRGICYAGIGDADKAWNELQQAETEAGYDEQMRSIIRTGYYLLVNDAVAPEAKKKYHEAWNKLKAVDPPRRQKATN